MSVRQPGQANGLSRSLGLNARTGGQVNRPPAIAPDHAGRLRVGNDFDGKVGSGADHDRPGKERMGADRAEQQRLDIRPDDRATGREGVCRRSGRCGHHHAIAAPGRERSAVDFDGQLDHAFAGRLFDGHLIEGPTGEHRLAIANSAHLKGHPVLYGVLAIDDVVDRGVQVLPLSLGEETHVAEVHSEQRDVGAAGEFCGPENRAIAPKDDHELAALRWRLGPSKDYSGDVLRQVSAGGFVGHAHADAGVQQATGRLSGQILHLWPTRVRHQQDAALSHYRRPPVARASRPGGVVRATISSAIAAGSILTHGGDIAHMRYSTLPWDPLIGL